MGESAKRRKKTKYRLTLRFYGIITALIVIVAGIILCKTVFFNITDVTFENDSKYTLEEIMTSSEISIGDNLFSMNLSKRAENLENKLAYVGTASFKRKLPSTLAITITAPTPKMNIQTDDGLFYLVSDVGKVLEKDMTEPNPDYPVIYGYEPADVKVCGTIDSVSYEKKSLVEQLISQLEENGINGFIGLDVSNITEITVGYNKYQSISLGTSDDIDFKLELAKAIIEKRGNDNEYGTINVKSTQRPAFIGSHGGISEDKVTSDSEPDSNDSDVNND